MGQIIYDAIAADILIVDDTEVDAEMLARRLRRLGYHAEICLDSSQACELLHAREFDLVLLDQMMPGLSGLEVLESIRQTQGMTDLPVIMVTARDTSDAVVTALECGANDYITKPIDFPVAIARIHTHLLLRQTVKGLAKAHKEIERLALFDDLTGIANRRLFTESLHNVVKLASRTQSPVSLVMIDVDKFKQINDNFGHQTGDRALQAVAEFLSAHVHRDTDIVARLGGDEFVLLLPATDAAGSVIVRDTLRADMPNLHIALDNDAGDIPISLSLGIATLFPVAQTMTEELVHLADQAMYIDKQQHPKPQYTGAVLIDQ